MNENKTNINWLACIYDAYHLNPYNMGISKEWDLASFNKKRRKIWKNRLKYTFFWEKLWYWFVICWHILIKNIDYMKGAICNDKNICWW